MNFISQRSTLSGSIQVPASKSHTIRAILLASMVGGTSHIENYLHSPDVFAMIKACEQLGAEVQIINEKCLSVTGVNGFVSNCSENIDAGNSGQVLRFITAIGALGKNKRLITGDYSICHNRPMESLISGLQQLGAFCISTKHDDFAPILVKGPLVPGEVTIDGQDSQPVSALLMACAFMIGTTVINVESPGERPWIDLTLSWLQRLGVEYERHGYERYKISGRIGYPAFKYLVAGDFSSLLFPIVAAILTNSEITLVNVDMDDVQGDKQAIFALQKMGADIEYSAANRQLLVRGGCKLVGQEIDVNNFIDSITALAVVGCFASGVTILKGARAARGKECDRLQMVTRELTKMGAVIEEFDDGLRISNSQLSGARVESHTDHRMAMSLAIAGMACEGLTEVVGVGCVAKSFPGFCEAMQKLGAVIKVAA